MASGQHTAANAPRHERGALPDRPARFATCRAAGRSTDRGSAPAVDRLALDAVVAPDGRSGGRGQRPRPRGAGRRLAAGRPPATAA
jgi:hypothetical protein